MRLNSCLWVPVLVAGLLVGCVTYQPRPLSPDQSAAQLDARALDDTQLKQFLEQNLRREFRNWPPGQWDFPSLTLIAFYYHPSLEVARAQWRVAQAGVITAGARPNPTLGVTPGYSVNPADLSPWLPAVTFDLPIETAGKRGHRIARAQQLSESARLNIATIAWQARSRLRTALLDYAAARQRESLLRRQLDLQEQMVKSLQQRVAAGALAANETTPSRILLARTRLDLNTAQSQRSEALARVAEALGVPLAALNHFDFTLGMDGPVTGELTGKAARERALRSRADIAAALAEYAATQSVLQLEIAKQYPDVHLGTGYQWDQGQSKWQLGLTVEIPVLNRNQGPLAEAEARRAEAAARFTAVQAQAISEIDRATAALQLAGEQLRDSEKLVATQRQQQQSVEAHTKAGALDPMDAMTVRLDLAAAELVRFESQVKVQQARAALEDAVQQPLLPGTDFLAPDKGAGSSPVKSDALKVSKPPRAKARKEIQK